MNNLNCSIGVIVYNEAANISNLLQALLAQKLKTTQIKEIIVVSSASSDGTDQIVQEFRKKDERIKLISENQRHGKSAAINKFIAAASSDILIIVSGDTIPAENTVEKMVAPFQNKNVGMTGGRPVPQNDDSNFLGYAVNLLWRMHHKMSLRRPKLGEMVAFRKVFQQIPPESAVDEASIEAKVKDKGLKKIYIPSAIIHNKGPENLADFIKQRRRIAAGHLWLKDNAQYSVSSQNGILLIKIAWEEIVCRPHTIIHLTGVAMLELYSRFLGWKDYKVDKHNPYKWDIAKSTKDLRK
ncbi:MAG: glycosyltransferase [Candidatus Cloacimonadota bacterium]|nr:glycosyltransferase [Candidatus Cloacimonadota bacterium]